MSIVVTTDVFCDECGNWIFGDTGHKADARKARASAKSEGWVRIRVDGRLVDLCPTCAGKHGKGRSNDQQAAEANADILRSIAAGIALREKGIRG